MEWERLEATQENAGDSVFYNKASDFLIYCLDLKKCC